MRNAELDDLIFHSYNKICNSGTAVTLAQQSDVMSTTTGFFHSSFLNCQLMYRNM